MILGGRHSVDAGVYCRAGTPLRMARALPGGCYLTRPLAAMPAGQRAPLDIRGLTQLGLLLTHLFLIS